MKLEKRSFLLCSMLCSSLLSTSIGRAQPAGQAPAAGQPQQAPRRGMEDAPNPLPYDLLLTKGHVIDAKNHVDKITDVAIKDGLIAKVGDNLDPKEAAKTVNVSGYYVTPGLIDLHMHVYASTGEKGSYAGDNSIWPDGFTLRNGVTTAVDAGSSGWKNFEDFKAHIIDRSDTRILAMLNIVGAGMRGNDYEQNVSDMVGEPTAKMALKYPDVIVGVKSAHFTGPEWTPYIEAVKAGTIAHIPVMIDYGSRRIERPLYDLLATYLRPGDIYTHAFSGHRGEQDSTTLKASAAMLIGRKRGIYFDAGTGGASFAWSVAIPLLQNGFPPDSLSTDLHIDSMNSTTKDMLNVMDKFLAMGQSLQTVIQEVTWNPAREIQRPQLGNLSVGAPADVAVLSEEHGKYGFEDMYNTKFMGDTKLICELTVRSGKVVYDLNGISMDLWNAPQSSDPKLSSHWTTFRLRAFGTARAQPQPTQQPK
jgi:dihydroorotase